MKTTTLSSSSMLSFVQYLGSYHSTPESTSLQTCAVKKSGCCHCSWSGGLQEHLALAVPSRPGLAICCWQNPQTARRVVVKGIYFNESQHWEVSGLISQRPSRVLKMPPGLRKENVGQRLLSSCTGWAVKVKLTIVLQSVRRVLPLQGSP